MCSTCFNQVESSLTLNMFHMQHISHQKALMLQGFRGVLLARLALAG